MPQANAVVIGRNQAAETGVQPQRGEVTAGHQFDVDALGDSALADVNRSGKRAEQSGEALITFQVLVKRIAQIVELRGGAGLLDREPGKLVRALDGDETKQ